MFLRNAALKPVPPWAVIQSHTLEELEETLGAEEASLQESLDLGYRDLDRRQPILAEFLADQVARSNDELAQAVGYFLCVAVYIAFREAFPTRLESISEDEINLAIETLVIDEELRANNPGEFFETDDIVAMGQPALLEFIQHHLEEAIEQSENTDDLAAFDNVYRTLLVEVVTLSHAIDSPEGKHSSTAQA